MTLSELKNDVAKLGFESYVEDEECFIASANRALSLIYADRPVSETAIISFRGPRATLVREFIEHDAGNVINIPFNGASISFRSTGTGSCIINDVTSSNLIPLSKEGQLTKQFLHGSGTITFYGNYYFTVSNLAVFDSLISNNAPDIPEYKPYQELKAEDYCAGFRSFSGHPKDKNGNAVTTVKLRDGKIYAPYNYRGELYLTYYRAPNLLSADEPVALVDISEECAPMLPLLTASFLWLDDDAGKAQYYMSLYRDLAANVKRYSKNTVDTSYSDNGWA